MAEDLQQIIDASTHRALSAWKISRETCEAWDYRTRVNAKGEGEHLAVYRDEIGLIVDAKLRFTGKNYERKDFAWASGKAPKGLIYGANRLGNGGKMVCVCMGEKDALTVSQLWNNTFPVVSPANGEAGIQKDFAPWLDRLARYDKVVIVQDMDAAGLKAGQLLAAMLPPGKAFLAKLPRKDANETYLQDGDKVLRVALHNATAYRPDGIVDADEIDASLLDPTEWGFSLPYDFLYKWTYGILPGQVWVIGAGTGIGKSDFAAEIVAHLIKPAEDGGAYQPMALFNYEAGPKRSLKLIVGKLWSKRFNIPDPEDGTENPYWSRADIEAARTYRREHCAKLFINDHRGAVDWASVKERLRFLKHSADISGGVVDPMAAMAAQEEDERKFLDRMMAESKSLAEELGIFIIFVSHLARPKDGKSHEEGGRATLAQFRGSGGIVMWASYVIVLERDQQGDKDERKDTVCRMLKDRETGDSTGLTKVLVYNTLNGRLEEKGPLLEEPGPEDAIAPPLGEGLTV